MGLQSILGKVRGHSGPFAAPCLGGCLGGMENGQGLRRTLNLAPRPPPEANPRETASGFAASDFLRPDYIDRHISFQYMTNHR